MCQNIIETESIAYGCKQVPLQKHIMHAKLMRNHIIITRVTLVPRLLPVPLLARLERYQYLQV